MKKGLAAVVAVLGVLGAGLYFFVARPLLRPSGVTPAPGRGPASFDVIRIDPATCQPGASWVVTVTREWIVMADPISRPTLIARLTSAPADTPERLAWWRGLARDDVASVGIPGLERLESGATQPFVKGGAKALAGEGTAFRPVYLGLGVKTVPPHGVLCIVRH